MADKTLPPFKLDRTSAESARLVIEKLLPQEASRRLALNYLADTMVQADAIGADVWGVTLFKDRVRLNIGTIEVGVLEQNAVYMTLHDEALTEAARKQLKKWGQFGKKGAYRTAPDALGLRLPAEKLAAALPLLQEARAQLIEKLASRRKRTTWYEAHSPGVIAYLQSALGRAIPNPSYVSELLAISHPQLNEAGAGLDLQRALRGWFEGSGLHFTPWQIATFYTALQVKGLVILSGISGTGKTRLAQRFAALLPQPSDERGAPDEGIAVTIQPYMLKYGRVSLPRQAGRFFDLPPSGAARDVLVTFDGHSQSCRLAHTIHAESETIQLHLRGAARQWLGRNLAVGDTLLVEPELDTDQDLINFHLYSDTPSPATPPASPQQPTAQRDKNALFLAVRPDWRDSKSLLGYYNPLTCCYEWTPLLRFLWRAAHSYRAGDGRAWFVILDEMNLARVEYYLADLLSVLETGRDENGFTMEPLRLLYPATAEGDLPPHELWLPPNLYFIGTVNIDETTHAFSPRVLDRAFTIELRAVDFRHYPAPLNALSTPLTDNERQSIARAFTHHSALARLSKPLIAAYVAAHPATRTRLQNLNDLLQPHNLHFGYRVFDEIIAFLAAAAANQLFSAPDAPEPENLDAAFDAAVLMKVLPKWHGSRRKLEAPLYDLLAWCLNPDVPDQAALSHIIDGKEFSDAGLRQLRQLPYLYPHTAARAVLFAGHRPRGI